MEYETCCHTNLVESETCSLTNVVESETCSITNLVESETCSLTNLFKTLNILYIFDLSNPLFVVQIMSR